MVFLWSISVEEQFYILWSIVLKWFQKYLFMISILLVIVSLVFRYYFLNDSLNLNFNTISTLGNFGTGAIIAIAAFKKNKLFKLVKNLSKTKIISIYLFMILVYLIMPLLMEFDFFIIIQRLLFSVFFSFIILEQSYCRILYLNYLELNLLIFWKNIIRFVLLPWYSDYFILKLK